MPKSIQQLFDLSSRVAIVTGGSRGLGLEIAEGLAEAGASLMLCARREQWLTPAIDALRERGFRVEGRACDVSDPDQVQAVVTAAIDLFSQAAGREMLKSKSGCIINIASVAGIRSSVGGPHYAGYVASKAGLMGLTRELAASWGPHGIRVNAMAPGFFHSRLADPAIVLVEASIKARNPIPRVGEAGELKGTAVFLASDASSYITGQIVAVDGGATVV